MSKDKVHTVVVARGEGFSTFVWSVFTWMFGVPVASSTHKNLPAGFPASQICLGYSGTE